MQFSRPSEPSRGWYAILTIGLSIPIIAVGSFALRRRGLITLLVGLLAACAGCGRSPTNDRPRLVAEVTPSFLVYEPNVGFVDLSVSVKNEGDRGIKVFQASGGCSCRRIDQSALPHELAPGMRLVFPVKVSAERSYEPRGFVLALSTDRGIVELPVTHTAIPRQNLSPGSINLGSIVDGADANQTTFELVHREVVEEAGAATGSPLSLPPEFSVQGRESREEAVPGHPGFFYLDTTYKLSLVDRGPGLKKSIVAIKGRGGETLSETPVVWECVSYLSSAPAKVDLGSRPIRAFLRCRDEAVELTRVLSAPAGVKAVVSSTREVTVALADGAPEILDGSIEIGTTAPNQPPLRIPVVRYAPLARRSRSD